MDISDCLSQEAQNVAEARLAAKRAARAEAREIRMKELERQQKEIYQVQKKYYGLDTKWGDIEQWMEDSERYSHRPRRIPQASDEDDLMSVGSRSSLRTNGYEDELMAVSQYRKSSRSSTGSGETSLSSRGPPRDEALVGSSTHYSDTSSALNSKPQQSLHNGSRPSLLTCNALPARSQRGSVYDEGVPSGSRRYSSSSSRPPSEYSCYLGSGSRASSRASSARASPVIEERPDKDFADKGSRPVSSLSAATLASLGGTSSRRGSADTSISVDTEASIREIKEISELKDQIEDVEGKYMQGLKEMKDSLVEVEEKYKRSMVTNAQLDNEKSSLLYQVETLRDVLLELEEELAESRRQYDEKHKECERQKHEHTVLRFQLAEMKEALEQREQLLTEIRQLQQKQESSDREICDLKETIEWKDKKIGALERQKDFFDPVRSERDDLREEVARLRETLKKHSIALDSDVTANGDNSSESHMNNDYAADSLMRGVSLGETKEADVKMEISVLGQCSLPGTEEDRNKAQENSSEEIPLHAEGERASEGNTGKDITSDKCVEVEPGLAVPEVCIKNDSEMNTCKQGSELQVDPKSVNRKEEEVVAGGGAGLGQVYLAVDGEVTPNQRNVSPVDGEFFQDALDFVVQTPSLNQDTEGENIVVKNVDYKVKQNESAKEETIKCEKAECTNEEESVKQEDLQIPEECKGQNANPSNTEESKNVQDISQGSHDDTNNDMSGSRDGACAVNVEEENPVIKETVESQLQANLELTKDEQSKPLSGEDFLDGKEHEKCEISPDSKESLDQDIKNSEIVVSQTPACQSQQPKSSEDKTTPLDGFEGDHKIDTPELDMLDQKDNMITEEGDGVEEKMLGKGQDCDNNDQNNEIRTEDQDDQKKSEQEGSGVLATCLERNLEASLQKIEGCEMEGPEEKEETEDEGEVFDSDGEKKSRTFSSDEPLSESEMEHEENEEKEENNDSDKDIEPSEKCPRDGDKPRLEMGSSVDRTSCSDDTEEKGAKRGKGKNKEDCVIS
ncbi:leucine-rich repeat flightless-interacting protein 1 isoform 4-T6 [Discoglossus pictus]